MERLKTARLIGLLHAQRAADDERSRQRRDSPEWIESTNRLDALNDRIMQAGAQELAAPEPIARDLAVDLDSRPIDDLPFHDDVVACVRRAALVAARERLASAALDRIGAAAGRIVRTHELIERAEAQLHDRYPRASLAESAPAEDGLLHLRAVRDGHVTLVARPS